MAKWGWTRHRSGFHRISEETKGGNGIGKRKAQNRGLVGLFWLELVDK